MRAPTLRFLIFAFAIVYVCLFVAGARSFVIRTAILPAFALYALRLASPERFLRDWAPLLLATIAYDFLRGQTYVAVKAGYLGVYADYVIGLERALFGTSAAPLVIQRLRNPVLDAVGVAVHATHFLFFLGFGLAVWRRSRGHFRVYRGAMTIVMAVGLAGYILVPTVPPWLAALPPYDRLPPIDHIIASVYSTWIPQLYDTFDTNPVAAMPSLHAAFPVVAALVGWRAFSPTAGVALSAYAGAAIFSAMYLGEHYAVDLVVGALLAAVAVAVCRGIAGPEGQEGREGSEPA